MKKRAYIFIILSGFLFATSGIFVRLLSPFGFSSMQMTAMRGGVSALMLTAYAALFDRKLFKTKPRELGLFLLSGVAMFLCAYFYYASLNHTTIATAVILMYTSPIYVIIFSVMFLKEKITVLKLLAIISMLVGVALVSGIAEGLDFDFFGVLFGLLSGVTYGIYNILTKLQMKRKNSPMTATLYCFIFMGILSTSFANVSEMTQIATQSPLIISLLAIGIGVFTCGLPYLIYTFALREIPAGTASAMGLIDPMAAIVYGVIFFSEPLSLLNLAGIILILGAVFALSRE